MIQHRYKNIQHSEDQSFSSTGVVCLHVILILWSAKSSCVWDGSCNCLHLCPYHLEFIWNHMNRKLTWYGPQWIIHYSYTIDGICTLNMIASRRNTILSHLMTAISVTLKPHKMHEIMHDFVFYFQHRVCYKHREYGATVISQNPLIKHDPYFFKHV